MQKKRKPLKTQLGIIDGRDAIHLDKAIQVFNPCKLFLTGEINTMLCDKYNGKNKWIAYKVTFEQVFAYQCFELDLYPSELEIVSSFDVDNNCNWLNNSLSSEYYNYIFSTYDYIYEVIARNFSITFGEERD